MFIDSHAHLDSPGLFEDLDGVLQRARDAGVCGILTIGCVGAEPDRMGRVLEIANAWPEVSAALGVHPHDAQSYSDQVEQELLAAMQSPQVLAWGEIGLDFYYQHAPRTVQEQVFRRQLKGARQVCKPVIIHSRDAADETLAILGEEFGEPGAPPVVMHCFTYGRGIAERCVARGYLLGLGGVLTFPKSAELREIAAGLDSRQFLIETDSPYLAPVPFRGRRNEPALVLKVAEQLAELRGCQVEEIGFQTTRNFHLVFHGSETSVGRPQQSDGSVAV